MKSKIEQQMDFLIETEKLKDIFRQSLIPSGRHENDAEHSWSLCMYAIVLSEYADEGTDMLKCLKMLLIHDIVEIYAGDTFLYDAKANEDKAARESKAADKIFSMLNEQGEELRCLWEEFDKNQSKEARFANIMDRFQPVILNYMAEGKPWKEHGVKKSQVLKMGEEKVLKAAPPIKDYYIDLLNKSVQNGYLPE